MNTVNNNYYAEQTSENNKIKNETIFAFFLSNVIA